MEYKSQVGQDKWVLSLFPEGYKGFFLDVGCYNPVYISNTYALEKRGWDGVAVDIIDYSPDWLKRKARFVLADATLCDFGSMGLPKVIDYLSLDIDSRGANYLALRNIMSFQFEFKCITIEHNRYIGEEYNQQERLPQRELLLRLGYTLAVSDVKNGGESFEDWWINPKYL